MDAITKNAKTGQHEFAHVGEAAWHRLGTKIPETATIDEWLVASGMGWNIKREALRYGDQAQHVIEGKQVLVRDDTHEALGIVSNRYKVVQPGEVIKFFERLVANEGFRLETAGTLFGGKRFWALAKVGPGFMLPGKDEVRPYLLLSTSADGSLATTARVTSVRVVCNNTLSAAHGTSQATVTVRHTSTFDVDAAHQQLGFVTEAAASLQATAEALTKVKVSDVAAETFLAQLCLDANFVAAKALEDVRKSQPYQSMLRLFQGGALGGDLKSVKGTAWGLVNAVTEHVDHHMKGQTVDHRLANAWYGKGDAAKVLAVERALVL